MEHKCYLIAESGSIETIAPTNGKTFELEEVQALVKGYIEVVYLNDNYIMIINENGKFGMKPNERATEIASEQRAIRNGDYICGPAIVCPSPMLP